MKIEVVASICILEYILFTAQYVGAQSACRFNQFRCSDGSGCLPTEKLCNGIRDCQKGEDELKARCRDTVLSRECGADEFRCRFGGCIPAEGKCDGEFDCAGGTDEAKDFCGSKPTPPRRPTEPPSVTFQTRSTTTPAKHSPPRTSKPKPSSSSSPTINGCAPIELESGQNAQCSLAGRPVDCESSTSPDGTVAEIRCDEFYNPPVTGSQSTKKTCGKGQWIGGNHKFFCQLDCGQGGYKPTGFVVGGTTSLKGKWPWHVGLYESDPVTRKFKNICGATLISKRAVVTAAHCVVYPQTKKVKDLKTLKLYLGKYFRDPDRNDEDVQEMRPRKIVVNSNYSYINLESDIAVIFLDKECDITPIVHPICLPDARRDDEVPVHSHGMLVGWGSIGNRIYPDLLQETSLPVISSKKCRMNHQALNVLVRATTFCAGYANDRNMSEVSRCYNK